MNTPSAPMCVWSHAHELAASNAIHSLEHKNPAPCPTRCRECGACAYTQHTLPRTVCHPLLPRPDCMSRLHVFKLHVQIACVQAVCPNHHAPTRANVCRSPSRRHDTPRHSLIESAKHAFYMQRRFVHTLHSFTLLPLVHTVVPISFNNGCFKHILCRSFIASGPLPR